MVSAFKLITALSLLTVAFASLVLETRSCKPNYGGNSFTIFKTILGDACERCGRAHHSPEDFYQSGVCEGRIFGRANRSRRQHLSAQVRHHILARSLRSLLSFDFRADFRHCLAVDLCSKWRYLFCSHRLFRTIAELCDRFFHLLINQRRRLQYVPSFDDNSCYWQLQWDYAHIS